MITPVWSASKSPPIQRLQNPTAGSAQPDQNDPKAQCQPKINFFNNIGQTRPRRLLAAVTAMPPTPDAASHGDRSGPIGDIASEMKEAAN
jgi:hypothetical protein